MNEKAMELFGNEEFLEKLEKMDDIEEVKKTLIDNGIEPDFDALKEQIVLSNEELSEDRLSEVSGGSIIAAVTLGWCIGKAIGVVGRTIYEDSKGKPRTYSTKDIRKAVGLFG